MGYNEVSNAYGLYDPSTDKVIERRDAIFDEVLTSGPPSCFHLTEDSPRDDFQHVLVNFSPSHYDVDPSNPMRISSRTHSIIIG